MESNLKSSLYNSLSYKNEVKSIISVKQGQNYGFILEIQSQMGTFFTPVKAFHSRDMALRELRKQLS